MKGLFGQFQILCTVLWDVVKMSSEGQHLSLGEIPLPQWVTAWLKRNLDLLLHVYRCAAIDILWYQSAPRMNAHTMVYDWDNSVTDISRLKIKFLCKKQTKTFSFFFFSFPFKTTSRRSELYEVGRFKCDSTHCFHSLILAAFSNSRCYFSNHMEKFLLKRGVGGRERNCFPAFGTLLKQCWYCVDSAHVQQALRLAGGMPRRRQPQDKRPCVTGEKWEDSQKQLVSSVKWCSVILGLICWELWGQDKWGIYPESTITRKPEEL